MAIAQDRGKICHGTLTTLSIGGTDLGPTSEDGVTFVANQTHFDQKIDQQVGTIKKTLTNREVVVGLTMVEATLARLHIALNLAAAALSGSSLTIDSTEAPEAQMLMVGVAPDANARSFILDAVVVRGSMNTMAGAKNNPNVLPIEVEALFDTGNSRFGIIGDA